MLFFGILSLLLLTTTAFTTKTFHKNFAAKTAIKSTTQDQLSAAKDKLLKRFDDYPAKDSIFVCPESLEPLKRVNRLHGLTSEKYFYNEEFGIKYSIFPQYYDLTIKEDVDKSFFSLTNRERVGQRLFQTPFMSGIYERGYRQNFEAYGFPGIDKEFEEIQQFFKSVNASTVVDLSCGSGFMSRKMIKSGRYLSTIC